MKPLIVAFTLLSAALWAQSDLIPEARVASATAKAPSYSQMYCAGFVTRQSISRSNFVLGSKESPHEDRFPVHSQLFLGGSALIPGQRYSILRQLDDPNREDSSPLQRKKLAKLGALYQDVGWATVHSLQKGAAVATFDFSCDAAIPGDLVVPFKDKPAVAFRSTDRPINSFREAGNAVKGQILGSKDFVGLLGTGLIVYTDFGSDKGASAGDYLLIMRGYAPSDLNRIDRASERLPKGAEGTAVKPAQIRSDASGRFPMRVLGEMVILSLTPQSSTAIITSAFSEMELGDVVEKEEGQLASNTPKSSGGDSGCRPASRLRRVLFLTHGCRAAK
jgi:hypothetical protein